MRRLFCLLFFLFSVALARAENCTQYDVWGNPTPHWEGTPEAACAASAGMVGSFSWAIAQAGVLKPGLQCEVKFDDTRPGGEAGFDTRLIGLATRTGDYCENPCPGKEGQSKVVNITDGWARSNTPGANDLVVTIPDVPFGGSMCDGQCAAERGDTIACYRSQVPGANGLHRTSCDYKVTFTGGNCSGMTAGTDPATPPPPCPGYVGAVNGKAVCVGTAGSPLPQSPKPAGQPPDSYGNPAAGDKPSSGAGSGDGPGRTPAVGSGGNGGGGSNAATPGGGSDGNGQGNGTPAGDGPQEIDLETCGLPGKPPCRIDETGTGNGSGAYDGAKSDLNTWGQSAIDGVNGAAGASGKETSWGFGFALPSGCTPYVMEAFEMSVNVCQFQATIHDLMAIVWIAVTIWLIIGMVGRAVGGGSS